MDATPESLKTSPVPPTFSDVQTGGRGESEREEIRDSEKQPEQEHLKGPIPVVDLVDSLTKNLMEN